MMLITGLGNAGDKYDNTRHNIGFELIDFLAFKYKCGSFTSFSKNSSLLKTQIHGKDCILLKPQTFMNLSGISVLEVMKFYKIEKQNIIVIHDDLDLATGKIKVKIGGGDGGHNGLKSITGLIGADYFRLRIGISKPVYKEQTADYVLGKIKNEAERTALDLAINKCSANIIHLLNLNLNDFMQSLNT